MRKQEEKLTIPVEVLHSIDADLTHRRANENEIARPRISKVLIISLLKNRAMRVT